MSILLRKNYNHRLLYDGPEDGYYFFSISVEANSDSLVSTVIDYKNVSELRLLLPSNVFENIVESVKGRVVEPFHLYKGEDGLSLVYAIITGGQTNHKYLIVLTKGETQPGRYKIFLEGVWQLPVNG